MKGKKSGNKKPAKKYITRGSVLNPGRDSKIGRMGHVIPHKKLEGHIHRAKISQFLTVRLHGEEHMGSG